jgi:hypothetical protein
MALFSKACVAGALCVLLTSGVSLVAADRPLTRPRLRLKVDVQRSAHEVTLKMRLTHTYERSIHISESDLPWGNPQSMVLLAAKAKGAGESLERMRRIDDPGPAIITWDPGVELKGQVVLNDRFADLSKALQEADVLVFWSYRLQSVDAIAVEFERDGGWLSIPRDKETH